MIFSEDILIRIAIFILGLCGFMVAKHIRDHKTKNTPLVCPIKFDCHTVVHSDYSKFLGVPVEIFGMIYYASVFLTYFLLIFLPFIFPVGLPGNLFLFVLMPLMFVSVGMSFIAFLFSIYLIAVQIFILKKGCSWCIVSAFISVLIFVLTSLSI